MSWVPQCRSPPCPKLRKAFIAVPQQPHNPQEPRTAAVLQACKAHPLKPTSNYQFRVLSCTSLAPHQPAFCTNPKR